MNTLCALSATGFLIRPAYFYSSISRRKTRDGPMEKIQDTDQIYTRHIYSRKKKKDIQSKWPLSGTTFSSGGFRIASMLGARGIFSIDSLFYQGQPEYRENRPSGIPVRNQVPDCALLLDFFFLFRNRGEKKKKRRVGVEDGIKLVGAGRFR